MSVCHTEEIKFGSMEKLFENYISELLLFHGSVLIR